MAITVINKPSNRFTIVSNTIVRDKRLSCGAKGVALIILHFPEDIVPTLDLLRYISPSDGRDKLRGYLQELEECKYLKRDTKRGTNGKFEGAEWTFDSDPTPVEPSTGEPEPGNPTSAEATIDNTNLSNTSGAKTIKDKTLDASASSASSKKSTLEPLDIFPIIEITRLPEKAQINHDVKLSGSKEAIEQLKAALPKQEKIPYKEISDYFLKKHREFRKIKDDKYMPKWGAKETLAVKRLWATLEERTTFSKPTTTLEKQIVIQKFMNLMVDRFISYLKKGKGQYAETTPILPSQLTTAVLDRLFVMSDIMDSAPKLEIKQYENKGIAIGPMPEGW